MPVAASAKGEGPPGLGPGGEESVVCRVTTIGAATAHGRGLISQFHAHSGSVWIGPYD